LEHFRVRGSVDGQTGCGAIDPDGTDHGGGMPVSVRGVGVDSFSPGGSAAQAGQIGLGRRFIQKDQSGRVKARLPPPPEPPRPGNVRTVLLTGAERLFLYVRFSFSRVSVPSGTY
jgi:hypothetical protein